MKDRKTKLMGVINVTPDSYFEGSRETSPASILLKIEEMQSEGASWIDIGAESTAPNASPVSEEEELKRLTPLFVALSSFNSIPLSIDTYKPTVAALALKHGFKLINDITGFQDPLMRKLAADSGAQICVMHMGDGIYPQGIISHLLEWFSLKIDQLLNDGIQSSQIILDPGIGSGRFGKSIDDNLQILHNLEKLAGLGFPLLLGVSRKKFLQQITRKSAEETLPATLAAAVLAIQKGVNILRVHDVAAHSQVLDVLSR